jgi:hypothetical protein
MVNDMIDINRKYRYRNGEEARILCVDRPNDNGFGVVSCDKKGDLHTHTPDGLYGNSMENHLYDLIEVKDKKVLWLGIDDQGYSGTYDSSQLAYKDHNKGENYIAIVKVEYYEGQFDE